MMNGRGKSDSAIVAGKPTNKAGQPAAESVEPSAEAEGECEPAKHAPGAGPGKCVTGADAHTASRKATEEGTVHLALPPYQRRATPGGILRPQARCRTGCGWADMAGLRGRPRSQDRGPARPGPSGSISGSAVSATLPTEG